MRPSLRVIRARRALFVSALGFVALAMPLGSCRAASDASTQRAGLPSWCGREYRRHGLHAQLDLYREVTPNFQRGDFDGDGRIDCAFLVRDRKSGKVGLVILHRRGGSAHVFGAGRSFGNGGEDWSWLERWGVVAGERIPDGKGAGRDALLVEKPESAGGVVYWDGVQYEWMQWGD